MGCCFLNNIDIHYCRVEHRAIEIAYKKQVTATANDKRVASKTTIQKLDKLISCAELHETGSLCLNAKGIVWQE